MVAAIDEDENGSIHGACRWDIACMHMEPCSRTWHAAAVLFFGLSEIWMIEVTLRLKQMYDAGVPNAPTKASLVCKVCT